MRRFESVVVPLFEADEGRESAAAHAHLLGQLLGLDFADSPHVRGIVDDGRQIRRPRPAGGDAARASPSRASAKRR
jgi:hypothetical protein